MKGTFKPGDELVIKTTPFEQIKKGDLIVFRMLSEVKEDFVVHRVMNRCLGTLIMRGDNCLENDKEPVIKENVFGQVIQFNRKGKIHKAPNGWRGIVHVCILHNHLFLTKIVKFLFRRSYIMIKRSGIAAILWKPKIDIVIFDTQFGPIMKHVHKGKTVAEYWIKKDYRWHRQPYDLIIRFEKREQPST